MFILFKRLQSAISSKWKEKSEARVSQFLATCVKSKSVVPKRGLFSPVSLLEGMERYDRRLKGKKWEEIKDALCKAHLLPRARRWAKSLFWRRRNFGVRVFALKPLPEDESLILTLIDDRYFLVRSIASLAAIRLESKKGVLKTLTNMSREPGYGKYYYSDLLSRGSFQVFLWIAEIAASNKRLHLICLEFFGMNLPTVPTPFLNADLKSEQPDIRKAALKLAIRNPQKGSIALFASCLKDSDEKIRSLGAVGLGNYAEKESYDTLREHSTDASWDVRFECAKSLQKLGRLDLIKDPEMTRYIKEFGDQ